jgi:2,4-dienoyl-CoA reductase-like NADH-dependent reductase (Old Yellow Enzyme family)
MEIAQCIRANTSSDFILGIKINSVEFQSGGFTVEEARKLCQMLEEATFDFVELSGGTYQAMAHERESTRKREAFFLEFADNDRSCAEQDKDLYHWRVQNTTRNVASAEDS